MTKTAFVPPSYLMIGGRKIRVVVNKDLRTDDNETAWGMYTYWLDKIELNPGTPASYRVQTLLHEAMHAALKTAGVTEFLDDKLEEAICVAAELIAPNIVFKETK